MAIGGGGGDGDGGGGEAAKKDEPPAAAPADEGTSTGQSAKKDEPPANEGTITATMSDVKMATDEDGQNPTEVFSPNDTFYCVGNLENAPEDTKITVVWIASDIEGVKPDSRIKQISARGGSGLFRFELSNDGPWPTGNYQVELYLDDAKEPTKALSFEVR